MVLGEACGHPSDDCDGSKARWFDDLLHCVWVDLLLHLADLVAMVVQLVVVVVVVVAVPTTRWMK